MRYFLDSFGCAKNQVDGEIMMAALNDAGWTAGGADDADLIIVNSCAFIREAKQESINAVLLWKKQYPGKKVLLAGCLAQRYGAELSDSLPEADGMFGNSDLSGVAAAASSAAASAAAVPGTAPGADAKETETGQRPLLGFPGQAYVKISEGCDNRCSFCAIPGIRGPMRCRPIADIAAECAALLQRGVKELCIIGQDIAAYRDSGGPALARLAAAIAKLPGSFWTRFLYLHPDHFPLELLDVMRSDSRLIPYFDIPFQHASPKILAAMNRRGRADDYLRLLYTIRAALPDAVIRSTFLVGFPGEDDRRDFAALLDFQKRARLDWLGVFTFSREEGTPAYGMKGRVPEKLALERKATLEQRQEPITKSAMDRFTGRRMDVLIEENAGGGHWLGRLYCQAPEVDGCAVIQAAGANLAPGMLVPCTVLYRSGIDLAVRAINVNGGGAGGNAGA
jgi:ribosomal protein S12 methylthiotransferase